MDTYLLNVKPISRTDSESCVDTLAHGAGEVLYDYDTKRTFDHSKRQDIKDVRFIISCHTTSWYGKILSHIQLTQRKRLQHFSELLESYEEHHAQIYSEIYGVLPEKLSEKDNIQCVEHFFNTFLGSRGNAGVMCFYEDEKDRFCVRIFVAKRFITETGFGKKDEALGQSDFIDAMRAAWCKHVDHHIKNSTHVTKKSLHMRRLKRFFPLVS
jgi:hypothetical protein